MEDMFAQTNLIIATTIIIIIMVISLRIKYDNEEMGSVSINSDYNCLEELP
mgnify:FL=1